MRILVVDANAIGGCSIWPTGMSMSGSALLVGPIRCGGFVVVHGQLAMGIDRRPAALSCSLLEPTVHSCVVHGVLATG